MRVDRGTGYGVGDPSPPTSLEATPLQRTRSSSFVDGGIASYAGLYLDGTVGQIEDVATLPTYRDRGLARAVVLRAVAEARQAGAELVFLVAAEEDWPKELYRRLGFDAIGVEHVVARPAEHDS